MWHEVWHWTYEGGHWVWKASWFYFWHFMVPLF